MALVKQLDDSSPPALIEHVGWQLWTAAARWKEEFDAEMVAAGFEWFREARAGVLAHLDRNALPQSQLVERMGLSKQAVQQLVDQLVEDGVLERREDPDDRRSRRLYYTARGAHVLRVANRIKRKIERAYRRRLGARAFESLQQALTQLNRT